MFVWLGTALALIGYYWVYHKDPKGLFIWTLSNAIFIENAWSLKQWPQVVLFVCFTIINIITYLHWKETDLTKS